MGLSNHDEKHRQGSERSHRPHTEAPSETRNDCDGAGDWVQEGFALCEQVDAFDGLGTRQNPARFSDQYSVNARNIAFERAAAAGYRLAEFSEQSPSLAVGYDEVMGQRWKPMPTAAYTEDFRPREPMLPPTYQRTGGTRRVSTKPIPVARPTFTNPDKILWPQEGYTKADLIHYYDRVSGVLLPHLRERPLIMERYPNGIAEKYFLQKDALPQHTPDWLLPHVHEVEAPEVRRNIHYIVADNRDVLLYLANYAAITLHPWSSRTGTLGHPDHVMFDLDPMDAVFEVVQEVALALKKVFDELGLRAYPKTSGASGIHVYLPVVAGSITHRDAAVFAPAIAAIIAQRMPNLATTTRSVRQRKKGTVYVDALQNGRGKTLASVYSVRARPNAPVSTPLSWSELNVPIEPSSFNIETVPKRLKSVGDLFERVLTDKQDILPLIRALRSA